MNDDAVKDELRSAIEARKELGEAMEPAVIDAFVGRIERRLADRAKQSERALQRKPEHSQAVAEAASRAVGRDGGRSLA